MGKYYSIIIFQLIVLIGLLIQPIQVNAALKLALARCSGSSCPGGCAQYYEDYATCWASGCVCGCTGDGITWSEYCREGIFD